MRSKSWWWTPLPNWQRICEEEQNNSSSSSTGNPEMCAGKEDTHLEAQVPLEKEAHMFPHIGHTFPNHVPLIGLMFSRLGTWSSPLGVTLDTCSPTWPTSWSHWAHVPRLCTHGPLHWAHVPHIGHKILTLGTCSSHWTHVPHIGHPFPNFGHMFLHIGNMFPILGTCSSTFGNMFPTLGTCSSTFGNSSFLPFNLIYYLLFLKFLIKLFFLVIHMMGGTNSLVIMEWLSPPFWQVQTKSWKMMESCSYHD